jgi:hypothetical protein
VYGWQRSGGQPIRWRSERVVTAEARPAFDVTRVAGEARVSIALGARSSTGYGIDVVRAEEQRGRILLVLRERAPTRDRGAEPRLTFPAIVVVLPDVDKPISVDWAG